MSNRFLIYRLISLIIRTIANTFLKIQMHRVEIKQTKMIKNIFSEMFTYYTNTIGFIFTIVFP